MGSAGKWGTVSVFLPLLLILPGCDPGQPRDVDRPESGRGNDPAVACTVDQPCPTSFHAILADPAGWDGRYVTTTGYLSYGRVPAMFSDQFSSDNGILRNAVELVFDETSVDVRPENADVVRPVRGLFKIRPLEKGHLGQLNDHDFVGTIESARIMPLSFDAWSCATASQEVKARYQRRGEPCVAHRLASYPAAPVRSP